MDNFNTHHDRANLADLDQHDYIGDHYCEVQKKRAAQEGEQFAHDAIFHGEAGGDTPVCASQPQGQAMAGKAHLLQTLAARRQHNADMVTTYYAKAHFHGSEVARLTTIINILTLEPKFAEFVELLGLQVP